jgi:glycosyltransferase involved in cell wall biosynthesis
MLFSVDAHAIGRHLTGNEVYVRNLLQGFASLGAEASFVAYVSAESARLHVPRQFAVRRVSANPFVRLGVDLAAQLDRDRPDLVHVQYTAPLACPVPVVVSVHDVSYVEHPEFFSTPRALQLRLTVRRTVRMASRVLCPSEFSRRSIQAVYGLDEHRVTVVPNAVSSAFRPVSRDVALNVVHARLGFRAPFVLTVGDLQPRKNQIGLIRAFGELIRSCPCLPHRLVLVGQAGWFGDRVRAAAAASPVADRIHFTGWVSDEDLVWFYGACDAFVFPSFYEGFGLPILEAMACARAVACSNTSAMPEVADSCALLFDPRSIPDMTNAMRDLLLDAHLRSRMERLGLQRSAAFSWDSAARQTLDVYFEVAGAKRPVAEPSPISLS